MSKKPYDASLSPRARELRKNATRQESRLWYEYLRDYQPRFTRQRIVGSYILDIYCGKAKLAVELDGSQHYEPKTMDYDIRRTKFLESLGILVLRFSNIDVDKNFEGVCIEIDKLVRSRLEQPLPSAGGALSARD